MVVSSSENPHQVNLFQAFWMMIAIPHQVEQ